MHAQNRDPLQDHTDQAVHRHAHQPLTELAVAVCDRADDDGGQRNVVGAESYLLEFPGVINTTCSISRYCDLTRDS